MTNDKPKQENVKLISVTTETRRFDIKECPQCRGTRKMTVYKEYTHEEIPCLTCLGEGYVAAPAPEDKPAAGLLYAALTELERTKAELNLESSTRQMFNDKAVALEAELAAARTENERLRAALDTVAQMAKEAILDARGDQSMIIFAQDLRAAVRGALENKD